MLEQEIRDRLIEAVKAECLRCGFRWVARVPNPIACPRCKSYKWNEPK